MKKCDELLKKAEVFEKLALYGDRKSFLNAIAQYAPYSDPNAPSSFEGDIPKPAHKSGPVTPIDPNVQTMLNELLKGKINPLEPDGKSGDLTRAALRKFQEVYKQSPTPEAVAQLYNKQKGPVNLDDAAKRRDELAKCQSIPPGMPGSCA